MSTAPVTSAQAMDFFASQDQARRKTVLLVFYYLLAVAMIVCAVYAAVVGILVAAASEGAKGAANPWDPMLFAWVAGGTLLFVVSGTLFKVAQLAGGGDKIAQMLGGRLVEPSAADPEERKILNVVEEVALASGMAVPRVYLLDEEDGINAFAAGWTPARAVIGVTRGAVRHLKRDELQGVIAHEFSHILNGDMRLNIRLMGVVHGILLIALTGYWILRLLPRSSSRSRGKGNGALLVLALFGLALMVIGYIGVFFGNLIKSAVSRQREFLADAAAVQFTRNPAGIAGALFKIKQVSGEGRLQSANAEQASHMFFANGLRSSLLGLFATHPPLDERIRRIDPSGVFVGRAPDKNGGHGEPPARGQAVPGASGFAAGGTVSVDHDAAIGQVGAPSFEHLQRARDLMSSVPLWLIESVRTPSGARGVVYDMLLDANPDVRREQMRWLENNISTDDFGVVTDMAARAAHLGHEHRIAVAELAIPALRAMSKQEFRAFRDAILHLAGVDRQTDLFEYTLQRMVMRHVAPVFEHYPLPTPRHRTVAGVMGPCVELLSCLAYWGTDDPAAAERAFRHGLRCFEGAKADGVAMTKLDVCGLKLVDSALNQVSHSTFDVKRQVVRACVACVADDGTVTPEEAELLRAVADSLDCPMPPFVEAKAA